MQATLERLRQRREELGEQEGGFTLIELLIVIVILGILAAIVVFAVQNLTGSSAVASCQSDFKTVETSLEAYKAQMATYPTTAQGLAQLDTTQTDGAGATVGPWLKDVPPTADAAGEHYFFTYAESAGPPETYTLSVTAHGGGGVTLGTTAAACSGVK